MSQNKQNEQLKIAWDALGEIVNNHKIPVVERALQSETVARDALEKMNNLDIWGTTFNPNVHGSKVVG
jgi:hypothetical protein